ncbi:MAG: archaemetzincin [Planctomycetota bacterium]
MTRRLALLIGLLVISVTSVWLIGPSGARPSAGETFTPPNAAQRSAAVGSLRGASSIERASFDAASKAFSPIPMPEGSDWLANHFEIGQTFEQYCRSGPNRPSPKRSTIYILPIGGLEESHGIQLDEIVRYANAFFDMPVKELPAVGDQGLPITERRNAGRRQFLAPDILNWLGPRVPSDAYCLLAVTMTDLYPDPDWNFVFGLASLRDRVGVYSFARYDPRSNDQPWDQSSRAIMMRRSCHVLAHEAGHMFGIKHCVHFHCLMNGANHLDEADSQPSFLCPVCLRKLHWATDCDLEERYRKLKSFSEDVGWAEESKWWTERLQRIRVVD